MDSWHEAFGPSHSQSASTLHTQFVFVPLCGSGEPQPAAQHAATIAMKRATLVAPKNTPSSHEARAHTRR
jgi:hypothetical protein